MAPARGLVPSWGFNWIDTVEVRSSSLLVPTNSFLAIGAPIASSVSVLHSAFVSLLDAMSSYLLPQMVLV
jgi:hypothetical protein